VPGARGISGGDYSSERGGGERQGSKEAKKKEATKEKEELKSSKVPEFKKEKI